MRADRRSTSLLCVALLAAPLAVLAQAPVSGQVEGTVRERVPTRSMRAVSIEAMRLDPSPTMSFTAKPDERGHFRLDSLPAGRYMIQLVHSLLDSLHLALPSSELVVAPGQVAHTDFALPAGSAIRDAVCPGVKLDTGRGVVAGRAVDADTDEPLSHATVVVSWRELTVDRQSLRSTTVEKAGVADTGPRGDFVLCGVPTERRLTLQLQHGNRAGGIARLTVSDDEGAVVHNLSLSLRSAPTMAALDSVERTAPPLDSDRKDDDAMIAPRLTGTATVTGLVKTANGPLGGAEVRVANTIISTMTDAAGSYVLNSLPAGTQLLYIRRLGYAMLETAVELRAGTYVTRDVEMQRLVSLDSIRIFAKRSLYPEFEAHRRANFFGHFLTADEIADRKPLEMSDLLVRLGGFSLLGAGPDARAISNQAKGQHPSCTQANVIIDGIEQAGINNVPPDQVAGIEVYPDGVTAPVGRHPECGVIVIWTKHYRPASKH